MGNWYYLIDLDKPVAIQFSFQLNNPGNQVIDNSGYERSTSNHQFVYNFNPPKAENSIHWLSPVYQINRIPFVYLLQSKNSPYPNELGHKMIARQLARMMKEF